MTTSAMRFRSRVFMANLIFKNIPNILTTIRIIILIPILVLFYFSLSDQKRIYQIDFFNLATLKINLYFLIIGILFVVASFSDFLDGYLARKYQLISNYGKVFDPIADKLLINAVLIYFAYLGVVNFYLVILLILRDIYVDGLRVFVSTKKIVVPANIFGKLKTVAQMVAIIITFFVAGQFVLTNTIANQIFNLAYYLATFFSLSSGGIYSYQIYQKYQMMVKQTNTEQTPTS
ncbi:CDP-diacylglycerol--glycerol-3-phosphate 3-phosphatidyltransferase [Mycoplasmoides gallisepticum CA06_2006.052-5-2P]|uniref:CDP-diacylglycerol--glycerol-3-phosphate 3-phosphatidyltransferase n=1 Tax=Mycoplasmoides gallisepticum WI01_2001.043-13-2P TaxID=1159201 RepID=J3YSV0_MYCGL|nr:CDP-diacylglycerol--glycerol-3-phosphate 3-phosphatidyltransferase [Mycoplasmoides gallisepticum]AFP75859.1 CDP-diacylglycerol--glycerol-3-phosphate 3-phosphatidyltransferase [Mycoplasmoides gallisepticum VA94_7994-1-7P]AFP76626.1 CDP-diacylglycerol--glycerol-3-phosphate 3-phosphatidyltransferase [Mycoplasmoides gallisepticum NC95_13295-2-2P]AFP77380.1 CDP-diacylglycerol--glycerol-3-phosphate 3-phosphatidyltransferase [Mycoplasmoides gallisepticum NC96_1596-4-2P]AFP78151.1 CDP-diacylglycerol